MLDTIRKANATFPPQKIILYGVEGIGKTTFGATFDAPVLLPVEDGAAAIDIDAFPLITNFDQIVSAIEALHGEHNFKTLVVDSLDWMEGIVWKKVIADNPTTEKGKPVSSIEDYGFGKGFVMADDQWRYIVGGFDSLRLNRGMNIVLLAHSEVKRIEPPETDPFDAYQMRLQKRACAFFKEWADNLLFCNYRVSVQKTAEGFGNERVRGVGTGDRVIYTTKRPAWDAKNRWDLPEEIYVGKDRTWAAFHKALNEATNGRYNYKGE